MSKKEKGQSLLVWVILVAIVVLIVVVNPHIATTVWHSLIHLWAQIVAGIHWLLTGLRHGNLTAIAILVAIVIVIILLLRRR